MSRSLPAAPGEPEVAADPITYFNTTRDKQHGAEADPERSPTDRRGSGETPPDLAPNSAEGLTLPRCDADAFAARGKPCWPLP